MTSAKIPNIDRLVVRWTIGNGRDRGFEMLRLSIASAFRIFGPTASYLVCVNTVPLSEAQRKTGRLPLDPEWRQITPADIAPVLKPHLDAGFMEGMAWKLMPLRTYPQKYELAIDNDLILWDLPSGLRQWLQSDDGVLLAEDVDRCLGSFDSLCPEGAWNAGIRGLAPGRDLAPALAEIAAELDMRGTPLSSLTSEIEEQGLQAAAVTRMRPLFRVRTSEVSLCSPFWPRTPEFGSCGAHFTGMNARHVPFNYYGRPADEWLEEHWQRSRRELYRLAGLNSSALCSTA